MKVLMLGWEYPPHISGGLGTACQGLTTALAGLGVDIEFVVPRLYGGEFAPHMLLTDPWSVSGGRASKIRQGLRIRGIPSMLLPYLTPKQFDELIKLFRRARKKGKMGLEELKKYLLENRDRLSQVFPGAVLDMLIHGDWDRSSFDHYGGDLFGEVAKFTKGVVALAEKLDFDIVHAHDWMTYPAGVAVANLAGVPLVTHVHSLEWDRSGDNVNGHISHLEATGLHAATTVITVSRHTRAIANKQYNVPVDKMEVVYNGVAWNSLKDNPPRDYDKDEKIVLFLGRVTFQKGPDYFVEAAAQVIQHIPKVKFILAGSGDMLPRLINRVHELGIQNHFEFPGFLKGKDVEMAYQRADLYVMPSVSEPFGLSAIEAMRNDVPTIISKQSGVGEIIRHVIKVDFWDVRELASAIINTLKYRELREDLSQAGRHDALRARWEPSAQRTLHIYLDAIKKSIPVDAIV